MEPNQCTKLLEGGIYTTLNVVKSGNYGAPQLLDSFGAKLRWN